MITHAPDGVAIPSTIPENRNVDFSPRDFLILYSAVVISIVASFFLLRRKQNPVRLNLRSDTKSPNTLNEGTRGTAQDQLGSATGSSFGEGRSDQMRRVSSAHDSPKKAAARASRYDAVLSGESEAADGEKTLAKKMAGPVANAARSGRPRERELNVLFQWNGHTWDAYEALGLPAGSGPESARVAYERQLTQGDPESMPFFKAAYEALLQSYAR